MILEKKGGPEFKNMSYLKNKNCKQVEQERSKKGQIKTLLLDQRIITKNIYHFPVQNCQLRSLMNF